MREAGEGGLALLPGGAEGKRGVAGDGASLAFGLAGRIALPRPFAARLLALEAAVEGLRMEALEGGLAVEGILRKTLHFEDAAGQRRRHGETIAFRRVLPGARPAGAGGEEGQGSDGVASDGVAFLKYLARTAPRASVEAVSYQLRLLPGRAVGAEVSDEVVVALTWAPRPRRRTPRPEAWGARYRLLQVEQVVADRLEERLQESRVFFDVPAAKVIDVHTSPGELATEVVPGAVLVRGSLPQQVYYVAGDGLIHYACHQLALDLAVEVPQAGAGMKARLLVRPGTAELELAPEGLVLREKVPLRLEVKVTAQEELEVLTDLAPPPDVLLDRERVRVEQVVGRGHQRHMVEASLALSAPAGRVTGVATGSDPPRGQVLAGRVIVEGTLLAQAFYAGLDGVGYHQTLEEPFSCMVEVAGAAPGMVARVEARVEESHWDMATGGGTLGIRLVVAVAVTVTQVESVEVVTRLEGRGVGAVWRTLRLERLLGQGTAQVMVQKRASMVTRALKLVDVVSAVMDTEAEAIPDQVIVQGRVHQQVFFVDRHKVERHQTEELTFSSLVDLPGALPGMKVQVHPRVKHVSYALGPDGASFAEQVVLELAVRVLDPAQLDVVTSLDWEAGLMPLLEAETHAHAQRPLPPDGEKAEADAVEAGSMAASPEEFLPLAGQGVFTVGGRLLASGARGQVTGFHVAVAWVAAGAGKGGVGIAGLLRLEARLRGRGGDRLLAEEVPFFRAMPAAEARPGLMAAAAIALEDVRWQPVRGFWGRVAGILWEADLRVAWRLESR